MQFFNTNVKCPPVIRVITSPDYRMNIFVSYSEIATNQKKMCCDKTAVRNNFFVKVNLFARLNSLITKPENIMVRIWSDIKRVHTFLSLLNLCIREFFWDKKIDFSQSITLPFPTICRYYISQTLNVTRRRESDLLSVACAWRVIVISRSRNQLFSLWKHWCSGSPSYVMSEGRYNHTPVFSCSLLRIPWTCRSA